MANARQMKDLTRMEEIARLLKEAAKLSSELAPSIRREMAVFNFALETAQNQMDERYASEHVHLHGTLPASHPAYVAESSDQA